MQSESFFRDVVDIKGRLIPGLLLLFAIYLISPGAFSDLDEYTGIQTGYDKFPFVFQLILLLIAYVLGTVNQFIAFRYFSLFWEKPSPSTYFRKSKMPKPRRSEYINFYENRYGDQQDSKSVSKEIFDECKEVLLIKYDGFGPKANKMESDANFSLTMLLPTLLSILFLLRESMWGLGIIAVIVFVILLLSYIRIVKYTEPKFIYTAFYEMCIHPAKGG